MARKYKVIRRGKVFIVAGHMGNGVYIPISDHRTEVEATSRIIHYCKAEADKCLNV